MDDAGICSGKWEAVQRTEPHAGTECQVPFLFVYPPQPPTAPLLVLLGRRHFFERRRPEKQSEGEKEGGGGRGKNGGMGGKRGEKRVRAALTLLTATRKSFCGKQRWCQKESWPHETHKVG